MNKKNLLFLLITLFCIKTETKITHILIDPNALFRTSHSAAAGHVGKWESLKYAGETGHLPSQKYFFEALQGVEAVSEVRTYDEGLEAPFIISDWLLGEPVADLKAAIQDFLQTTSFSQPEKNIYTNTSNMMFDPQILASIQKVQKKIEKLLKQLKQKGYTVFFIGNWTDIMPLKNKFPQIFKYIDDIYTSSELKQLKPEPIFWETIFKSNHLDPANCLCIEAEPRFYQTASSLGCKAVLYDSSHIKHFVRDLKHAGVSVSL